MKKTVYDAKTGESIELEPVDARERLQAGLAVSVKPVVKESLTTEIEQPVKVKKLTRSI